MSNSEISVEVYRDVECRDAPVDAAESGVDLISRITTGIQIVRASRLLRIAPSDSDVVNIDKIRWPKFDADLNVVLTERPICANGGTVAYKYGVSVRDERAGSLRVAVVDINHPDFPDVVAAHELGHLFSLKKSGESWDNDGHCKLPSCLMQQYTQTIEREVPVTQRGLRRLSEKVGFSSVQYETTKHPKADEFCQECARQLDKSAFFLKESKAGKYIPSDWL
ncbi:MAG: hypothetical protein ABIR91_00735 [Candidatus Saccharimonadales bacterium]